MLPAHLANGLVEVGTTQMAKHMHGKGFKMYREGGERERVDYGRKYPQDKHVLVKYGVVLGSSCLLGMDSGVRIPNG